MCHGNGPDHCCHLGRFGVCAHLEENTVEGRRWACGFRRRLGSWEAVHADPQYLSEVAPLLKETGIPVLCGDWPQGCHERMNGKAFCCYGELKQQ